jgi:hypothetical protein
MANPQVFARTALVLLAGVGSGQADEVRYYQQNGVTYCETRRTIRERVPETRYEERQQTFYREELGTDIRSQFRSYWTPVTEYRWESFWVGRWNPLVRPYLAYRYVPRTHWEQRMETVKTPVPCRRVTPETRAVKVPIPGWRVVEREETRRVAVAIVPLDPAPFPAGGSLGTPRGEVGGIALLDEDPPRLGTNSGWRSSARTIRR